jgi:hypothetical protein
MFREWLKELTLFSDVMNDITKQSKSFDVGSTAGVLVWKK